jgi:hypothetical protein
MAIKQEINMQQSTKNERAQWGRIEYDVRAVGSMGGGTIWSFPWRTFEVDIKIKKIDALNKYVIFWARSSHNVKPFVWVLDKPIAKRFPGGGGYIPNLHAAGPCDPSAMVMLFFFCSEALNRENRTIPTWGIYERLLSDLCSERDRVFFTFFVFVSYNS